MKARMPILTGAATRRVNGARLVFLRRADSAAAASRLATDERAAAALRGKAKAYREAADMLRRVDRGGLIRKKSRHAPP